MKSRDNQKQKNVIRFRLIVRKFPRSNRAMQQQTKTNTGSSAATCKIYKVSYVEITVNT